MREVYVDNAATTPLRKEVLEAMLPYLTEHYGNPSSVYRVGREAKAAVEEARHKVATAIGAQDGEVYFTSGGSESDNWAIKGVAYALKDKGRHIITSAIEHHAVLHTCQYLERNGYEVTYLPVDENGIVSPESLEQAIRPDTVLVTIMTANNEIGTIQPIPALAQVAHAHGVVFHTDGVQAVGHIPVDVKMLGVDLLSLSGHKFEGPKGVGALYIKNGTKITNFIHGGGQESGKRPTTENVAGIVGIGEALRIANDKMMENVAHITSLRDYYIQQVESKIKYCRLNGDREKRLPGNTNFSFRYIEGESLLLSLDMKGIAASSGSACTSGSLDPSHVLLAIGLPHEIAHGSLRVTFGEENTKEDVDYIVENLIQIVQRLRDMSPLYEGVE